MNEYYNPNNQGEYNNPNTQQNYYNQNTQPQQPPYQAPVYQPINQTNEVMSVGSYIGMFLLSAIPVVNIICWIVWLVSPNTNKLYYRKYCNLCSRNFDWNSFQHYSNNCIRRSTL